MELASLWIVADAFIPKKLRLFSLQHEIQIWTKDTTTAAIRTQFRGTQLICPTKFHEWSRLLVIVLPVLLRFTTMSAMRFHLYSYWQTYIIHFLHLSRLNSLSWCNFVLLWKIAGCWRFTAGTGMYFYLLFTLILFTSLEWWLFNCYPHPQTLAIDGTCAAFKVTGFPCALYLCWRSWASGCGWHMPNKPDWLGQSKDNPAAFSLPQ